MNHDRFNESTLRYVACQALSEIDEISHARSSDDPVIRLTGQMTARARDAVDEALDRSGSAGFTFSGSIISASAQDAAAEALDPMPRWAPAAD